jgi:hypothetical protein
MRTTLGAAAVGLAFSNTIQVRCVMFLRQRCAAE